MNDDEFPIQDFDKINTNTHRYFQVDILKAIMIFLVIFDHTVPWDLKDYMGVALWKEFQSLCF